MINLHSPDYKQNKKTRLDTWIKMSQKVTYKQSNFQLSWFSSDFSFLKVENEGLLHLSRFLISFMRFNDSKSTHQGVLHECVSVMYLTPNSYNILKTPKLAVIPCPDSNPIKLATFFWLNADSISAAVLTNVMLS